MISKGILEMEAGSDGDGDRDHQDGDAKPHDFRAGVSAVADGGTTGGVAPGSGSNNNCSGSTGWLIVKRLREAIQVNSIT